MAPVEPPFDLAVIGAGPAGLTASVTAADAGLKVAVLDLGERVGGQYWRHTAQLSEADQAGPFHHDWNRFIKLRARFSGHVAAGRITHLARHSVWTLERSGSLCVIRATRDERTQIPCTLRARAVIVATGAHDRHIPFPGWTLPGVMAGGGAQSLLKGSAVAAGTRAVVAGTGPFLLPVAQGLLSAGVEVVEIVDPNVPWQMARHVQAMPVAVAKLSEAVGYGSRLRHHGVRVSTAQAVIAASGHERLRSVTIARVDANWRPLPATEREVECDLLTIGYGFTPQVELALAAGCETALGSDGSLIIVADTAGRTSVPGIYAAGETTGVGGADLAVLEGQICGTAVVEDLRRHWNRCAVDAAGPTESEGVADRERGRTASRRASLQLLDLRRRSLQAFATALHDVFAIKPGWKSWLDAETLICRCEEVPYTRVRAALDELGAGDARTVKLLARPGMGWCQGRICGSAVAALCAEKRLQEDRGIGDQMNLPPPDPSAALRADLVAMSRRVIGTPIPLSQLAALALPPDDQRNSPGEAQRGDS